VTSFKKSYRHQPFEGQCRPVFFSFSLNNQSKKSSILGQYPSMSSAIISGHQGPVVCLVC